MAKYYTAGTDPIDNVNPRGLTPFTIYFNAASDPRNGLILGAICPSQTS
jgi:hypothetical protein